MQLHQRPRSEASKSDEWETDKKLFEQLNEKYGLDCRIDVAATAQNTKCETHIEKEYNGLWKDWTYYKGWRKEDGLYDAWCNPPNSLTQDFIEKANEQWERYNIQIMMLIPINATVTKNGKKYIWDNPLVEIHPVLPTPKFIYNGVQGESARNRYCVCIWRKRV